jgi:hypothetical protein
MTAPARLHSLLDELPPEDAARLADGIAAYVDGDAETLADALRPRPAALDARNNLLAEARRRFLPDASDSEAARRLAESLSRYRNSPDWRRDRAAAVVGYRDSLRGHCWAILKARDLALSERQVRRLLGHSGV